jgi:protein-disulfide isomerase
LPLLEQVLEIYPKEVKLVFMNFPLRNHKFARQAAAAALAADRQGKFREFHDRLFNHYNRLNDEKIRETAADLGLNMDEFEKDTKDPRLLAKINQDVRIGISVGVKGIPSIFINGRLLRNRNLKGFQAIIENELKKASE